MQQLFRLLIFLIQPYMFRATNSPILRSNFWLCIQLLVQCTDTAADRCRGWDGTQPYMFRATNSPNLRSTFWLCIQLLVQCIDTAADRCHGWDGNSVTSQHFTAVIDAKRWPLVLLGHVAVSTVKRWRVEEIELRQGGRFE